MSIPAKSLAGALGCVVAVVALGSANAATGNDSLATAQGLLQDGEAERAAAMFSRLLLAEPGTPEAQAGRVRALLRQDLWEAALDEARVFHGQNPADGITGVLGEALVRAGRLAEARVVLESPALDAATDGRTLATWARVLGAEGNAEARTVAARAAVAAPEDRDVLLWAADLTDERARKIELLDGYLERSSGDDPDRIAAVTQTRDFLKEIGDRRFWVPADRPPQIELPLRPVPGTGGPAGYTVEMTGAPTGGKPGKKVRLLLDTGSAGLFMVERAARKLGFEALDRQTAFGGGGKRRHETRRGVLPEAAFGGLRFRDALVSTSDRPIHASGAYQGVVSLSAFSGYRITIDMAARRLLLEPAEKEVPGGQAYWVVANQWLVEAQAGGSYGLFLLDTGAQASVLSTSFAPGVHGARLGGPANGTGFGGALTDARWIHGASVELQGKRTPTRPLRALDLGLRSRLSGVELAGFAGLDLLDGARLILDTTRQRMRLEQPSER